MQSVVLLSGGLDSAACLLLTNSTRLAITFDYGQRSADREIRSARAFSEYFRVSHRVIPLAWMRELKGALTQTGHQIPKIRSQELDNRDVIQESARIVWVPNRNGVFLSVSASIAENEGLNTIVVGFNKEEASSFPDNSKEFVAAFNDSLTYSTRDKVTVTSPTLGMTKFEIVQRLGSQFPYSLLWSCYGNEERMCGWCESCQRLKRALIKNEVNTDGLFIHQDH